MKRGICSVIFISFILLLGFSSCQEKNQTAEAGEGLTSSEDQAVPNHDKTDEYLLVSSRTFDSKDRELWSHSFEYDSEGKLIRRNGFNYPYRGWEYSFETGNFKYDGTDTVTTFFYNSFGKMVSELTLESFWKLRDQNTYQYDSKGTLIRSEMHFPSKSGGLDGWYTEYPVNKADTLVWRSYNFDGTNTGSVEYEFDPILNPSAKERADRITSKALYGRHPLFVNRNRKPMKKTIWDGSGKEERYNIWEYDEGDRLIRERQFDDPADYSIETIYEWDEAGNNTFIYEYQPEIDEGPWQVTEYQYDNNGNLYKKIEYADFNGTRVVRSYTVYEYLPASSVNPPPDAFLFSAGALSKAAQNNPDIPVLWPIAGGKGIITNPYGPQIHPFSEKWYFHKGIDIAVGYDYIILAASGGRVKEIGYDLEGLGHYLIIDHGSGFTTFYGQLKMKPALKKGDTVEQGQQIGFMGSSGISTGPHLHFEIRYNDRRLDPEPFLDIGKTL
jgi:murein DD-endopeptidase MepM/ murein hydrolase activator NlpD